jgi:hypothetical protein
MTLIHPFRFHSPNGPNVKDATSHLKGLLGQEIYVDIVRTFEPDVVGFSFVMLYLREARCASLIDPKVAPNYDHEPDDSDQAILAALSEQPFASLHEL